MTLSHSARNGRRLRGTVTYSEKVWIDASGREHALIDMEEEHIVNCVLLLKRKRDELLEVITTYDDYNLRILNDHLREVNASIGDFLNELGRRADAART